MRSLRIALAQVNLTVGDLEGNTEKILQYIVQAKALEAELVIFPEMAITGYPPEDLLLKPQFIDANLQCLDQIARVTQGITAIVGFVDRRDDIYNAAAVVCGGSIVGIYHKHYLPNYGVFDENRYFQRGTECPVFVMGDITVGVNICEDIWYPEGPPWVQALQGNAEVIANISSSPYHMGKGDFRERMLATRAHDNTAIVAFTNLVGGQDELVFDGRSVLLNERGQVIARGPAFEEALVVADLKVGNVFRARLHDPRRRKEKLEVHADLACPSVHVNRVQRIHVAGHKVALRKALLPRMDIEPLSAEEEIYKALVVGTRDYVQKNGFEKVVIGLSGGIDSSLTAVIAADALGVDNVVGVTMPSMYSSEGSRSDAQTLAANLGMSLMTLPIQEIFEAYLRVLRKSFGDRAPDSTEENIQARIRGNLLMALSNKFGWLVLTTGNKSEVSTGYCTLYGDMAGGFAVIKDVPKTWVYRLAEYRNGVDSHPVIPRTILEKAPSAELRPDQRDTDSLPPYEVLDPILQAYVEEDQSFGEIVDTGADEETVRTVIRMVDRSEYKRRQGPPGIKITPRAFGRDRRLPITNRSKIL